MLCLLGLRLYTCLCVCVIFFFQAEDGIRDLVRSRGLGDVYKRQVFHKCFNAFMILLPSIYNIRIKCSSVVWIRHSYCCLLYTSDAADERSSVDLGGRRIIKKKKQTKLLDDSRQQY